MEANPIELFKRMQDFNKPYISLKDGESVKVANLKRMEYPVTDKFGKEVLRMYLEVEVPHPETGELVLKEKTFDRGTQSWSDEISEAGLNIGSSFVMTRRGAKGAKDTKYVLSEVVNKKAGQTKEAITPPAPSPDPGAKPPVSKDNAPAA